MRMKFKMSGNSEVKVKAEIVIEAPRYTLTRDEVRRKKEELQNELHKVLRDFGYDISEIRLIK